MELRSCIEHTHQKTQNKTQNPRSQRTKDIRKENNCIVIARSQNRCEYQRDRLKQVRVEE